MLDLVTCTPVGQVDPADPPNDWAVIAPLTEAPVLQRSESDGKESAGMDGF